MKLLDKVRGQTELDCLLGKTGKESEEKFVVLARLYLAIQYEEKRVGSIDRRSSSKHSRRLVRRPFELSTETRGNLAQSNPKYIQIELVDPSATDRSLHLSPAVCECILHSHLVVEAYDQGRTEPAAHGRFSFSSKFQRFFKQPCIKFIGRTISYGVFIALIIVSSLLSAEEFQKPLKHLRDHYPEVADALNQSLEYRETNNQVDCVIYPNDDLVFRFDRPTSIDIAISVFVIGNDQNDELIPR